MAKGAAWVRFGWDEPFLWRRLALGFTLAGVPAMVCFAQGWGIVGLFVMAIGAWPLPPRVWVDSSGLRCRWLFVEQSVPLTHITHVRLVADPRRGVLLSSTVLSLGRYGRHDLLILAELRFLERLEHELRTEAARSGALLSS